MGVNSASHCTRSPDKVSDASRRGKERGKAASTRGTRYIALHPRHCARFSAMRISEILQSRADDRTRRWRMAVVTMRSRIRYGIAGGSPRNEHKILGLFRRTPIPRFLYLDWAFQIFSQSFPPSPPPSRFSRPRLDRLHTSWPAPRLSSYFSRYVSESLPLLHLFSSFSTSSWFARSKRSYTRARSRLSYLASLLGKDLSCGTFAASRRMLVEFREVGRYPRGWSVA